MKFLKTGEVADYCGVTLRTVLNWIQKGQLKAHQLPGRRRDNRVAPKDLLAFMERNGIPVPNELRAVLPGKPSVVIVDDEPQMQRAIARVAHRAGLEPLIAANGFEAGRLCEKHEPSVMTLDLQMPGLNGFALLGHLGKNRSFSIIVVSGLPEHDLQRALSLGADYVLAKPFANEALEHLFLACCSR